MTIGLALVINIQPPDGFEFCEACTEKTGGNVMHPYGEHAARAKPERVGDTRWKKDIFDDESGNPVYWCTHCGQTATTPTKRCPDTLCHLFKISGYRGYQVWHSGGGMKGEVNRTYRGSMMVGPWQKMAVEPEWEIFS